MVTSTQMTAGQRRSALPRTLGAIRNNIPSVSGSALTMTIGLKYNTVHVALIPPRAPTNPTVPQYDMRLESGESLRMPKSSHRQTLFFEATYEQVGIIGKETLPEAFWEQSCPVALPERWEPILVEGMAMADTDKSILRALPVTAVFLDVHQRCVGCPRNATQNAKLATMQDKIEAQDERSSRIKFIMYA